MESRAATTAAGRDPGVGFIPCPTEIGPRCIADMLDCTIIARASRTSGVLMIARWLPHRFTGIEADLEGRMTITTVKRTIDALRLNYRCKPGGSIAAELIPTVTSRIHPDADPIPGFSFAESDLLTGDELSGTMTWQGKSDLSQIGDTVAIRLKMFQAKLFAFSVGGESVAKEAGR